jgi:hypothetical protein
MKTRFLAFLLLAAVTPAFAADLSITAANVVPSSQAHYAYGTAGATVTAGQLVYFDTVNLNYKLASSNASSTTAVVAGIAVNNAGAGQPITLVTYDPALAIGATVAAGSVYVASANAGMIAPNSDAVTGWYVSVVCVAETGNKVFFSIVPSGVPHA